MVAGLTNSAVNITLTAQDVSGVSFHLGYVIKPDWVTITQPTDADGNTLTQSIQITGTTPSTAGTYDLIVVRGSSAFDDTDPKLGTPVSGTVANVTDYQKFGVLVSAPTSGKK